MQKITAGRPRKSDAGGPAILEGRQFRRGGDAQWQTWIPQRIVAHLGPGGYLVQYVSRLSVIRPGQPQGQDQVIREPDLVGNIRIKVRLAKIQIWISGSDANSIRGICRERREVSKLQRTVVIDKHC